MKSKSELCTVSQSNPCAVCGKPDWCAYNPKEDTFYCRRFLDLSEPNRRKWTLLSEGKDGGHFLKRKTRKQRANAQKSVPSIASIDTLHKVYCHLMYPLRLEGDHFENLRKRGLSEQHIRNRNYQSLKFQGVTEAMQRIKEAGLTEDLPRVPGFCCREGEWSLTVGEGMLIPCLDTKQRIQAFQVRNTNSKVAGKYYWLSSKKYGGPSPGSPCHVPLGVKPSERIRITEGLLKADIATDLSGIPTLGIPGVNQWKTVFPVLAGVASPNGCGRL